MNPNVWGPVGWKFLHSITFNYPHRPTNAEMKSTIDFFGSLGKMLPCTICQQHYENHLKQYPIEDAVINRSSLVNWLINIHNQVNIQLGKPVLDPLHVIKQYKKWMGHLPDRVVRGKQQYLSIFHLLIILVILILLVFYFKLIQIPFPKR